MKMGQAGQYKVLGKYTWEAVADQFRTVYVRALERRRE